MENEILLYEISNYNMIQEESSDLEINAKLLWDSVQESTMMNAWACLFPSGSCIFIQRVLVDDSEKVKYLKCSIKGINTLEIIPDYEAFRKVVNREIFNRGGGEVVHYHVSLYFPITENYERVWENINRAYLSDSYILRIVDYVD